MTRDEEQALWRAVLDDPHSVATRAAFAQDIGGERGAFMLAQIEASDRMRAGRASYEPNTRAMRLLRGHERAWAGPIVDAVYEARFLRGCVEWIVVDAARFVREWRQLYELAPIRHLDLVNAEDRLRIHTGGVAYIQRLSSFTLSASSESVVTFG
jgi:hypothetical protein